MQPNRRHAIAPWERRTSAPNHPVGRARRRWPRAYDGGAPPPSNPRYRRSFDGGEPRRPSAMQRFRQSPLRHGMLALGVAGAAAPIAMHRYQTNIQRTDPSHERVSLIPGPKPISELTVSRVWRAADAQRNVASKSAAESQAERDQKIQENIQKYSSYDIPRPLAEQIYDIAKEANIDVDVAFGLVRTESAFKNSATSHVGAMGLTQLMPRTAAWLQPGTTKADLRDSQTNLELGFHYLRDLIDKYDGDQELALLAYNRGPGTVDRVLEKGGNPDNGYPDMVLRGATPRH